MNTGKETFHKTERLCSRKVIYTLFESGNIINTSFFKVFWLISPEQLISPAQVIFSVSKKTFRKAVTRNLIKRRMREAYRKMKYRLYDFLKAEDIQIVFSIVYRRNAATDFSTIEDSMKELLDKLSIQIRENQHKS